MSMSYISTVMYQWLLEVAVDVLWLRLQLESFYSAHLQQMYRADTIQAMMAMRITA